MRMSGGSSSSRLVLSTVLAATLGLIVPVNATGQEFDSPNLNMEERLFRIYSNVEPVSPERWSQLLGTRQQNSYQVQTGDTLWDISQTLFGDGFFWSKLWAENGGLENPHRIDVGQSIRFTSGNEAQAPSVGVESTNSNEKSEPTAIAPLSQNTAPSGEQSSSDVAASEFAPLQLESKASSQAQQGYRGDNGEWVRLNTIPQYSGTAPVYREQVTERYSPEQMAEAGIEEGDLVSKPEVPGPSAQRPVLKDIPPSFKPRPVYDSDKYDITGLDKGEVIALTRPAKVAINSFISQGLPQSVGQIIEIERQESIASLGQSLFLKLQRPAKVGESFSVLYPTSKIDDGIQGKKGPIIEVGGIVEVIEAIDPAQNIYRASVTFNVNPIRKGSLVSETPLIFTDFAATGARKDIEVKILGAEFESKRQIIGESSIVYLDGGQQNGIQVGDLLPIRAKRSTRRSDTKLNSYARPIGLLKVLKTEPKLATAIVVEAIDDIRPGDTTGGRSYSSSEFFKEAR